MVKLNVPKALQERFGSLEKMDDLMEGCKYILTLADGWRFTEGGYTYPVRSKTEAIEFLRYETVKDN